MKIAMIGHKRIPSRAGGIEVVVGELAERLTRRKHEVTVFNRGWYWNKGKRPKSYEKIKIINVPTIDTKCLDAIVYSFIASCIVSFSNYDIIHYHALGPSVMLLIPHLTGKKIVVTVHGLDWKRNKWGHFAAWYLKLGEKITARYADSIIVLSLSMKKYFKEQYNRNTVYTPNGIQSPACRPSGELLTHYGLISNHYILFLARVVPEKGLHYLLEAFRNIQTDFRLVVAGESSHSDEYVKKINEIVQQDERIVMTGFVQGEVLGALFGNAYIYILPSDVEGMPISLLEAMSYGNCCLVSDIDENMEVIREYGQSFKAGDIQDLADNIKELLSSPETVKHYKEKAAAYILDKYNWETVVDETAEIYSEVIGQQIKTWKEKSGL